MKILKPYNLFLESNGEKSIKSILEDVIEILNPLVDNGFKNNSSIKSFISENKIVPVKGDIVPPGRIGERTRIIPTKYTTKLTVRICKKEMFEYSEVELSVEQLIYELIDEGFEIVQVSGSSLRRHPVGDHNDIVSRVFRMCSRLPIDKQLILEFHKIYTEFPKDIENEYFVRKNEVTLLPKKSMLEESKLFESISDLEKTKLEIEDILLDMREMGYLYKISFNNPQAFLVIHGIEDGDSYESGDLKKYIKMGLEAKWIDVEIVKNLSEWDSDFVEENVIRLILYLKGKGLYPKFTKLNLHGNQKDNSKILVDSGLIKLEDEVERFQNAGISDFNSGRLDHIFSNNFWLYRKKTIDCFGNRAKSLSTNTRNEYGRLQYNISFLPYKTF